MLNMADILPLDLYLGVVTAAAESLAEDAEAAGLDSPVPTCRTWTVADLVAHLGMVRWAAANLRGDDVARPSKIGILDSVPSDMKAMVDGTRFIAVTPSDADRGWTMTIGEEPMTTTRERADGADATFSGTAAQLYLGLCNRGDEVTATGRRDVLDRWRAVQRVRWS
jgi:hypothetical protein